MSRLAEMVIEIFARASDARPAPNRWRDPFSPVPFPAPGSGMGSVVPVDNSSMQIQVDDEPVLVDGEIMVVT